MQTSKLTSAIAAALLLGAVGVMSGCNTVEGMGEDVAALGRTVSGASKDVQQSASRSEQQQQAEARSERQPEQTAEASRR